MQKQTKTRVMLVQCSSDNGPQLTAALHHNHESRNQALDQLAVIIEHVLYELTDIMVGLHVHSHSVGLVEESIFVCTSTDQQTACIGDKTRSLTYNTACALLT